MMEADTTMHRFNGSLAQAVLLALLAFQAPAIFAQTDDSESGDAQGPTHRLDFGIDWFDTPSGRRASSALRYVWAPLGSHSFSTAVPFSDTTIADNDGSGIGDLQLRYNYAPSVTLTASPWVPNRLGMGLGLVIPTGDVEKGTGSGQWVAAPSVGWVIVLREGLFLLPQGQYSRSFKEEQGARKLEVAAVSFGLLYVWNKRFWVNFTPAYIDDLEQEVSGIAATLILGLQPTRRVGLSLDIAALRNGVADDATAVEPDVDHRITLKIHWVVKY